MLNKILLSLIFVIILGANSYAQKSFPNIKNKRITLGVIVPLTGTLAFFGNDFVRAYELAIKDNPIIENNINVLWEDSAYDSKQSISAFNKLVSIKKSDIILSFGGPMLSVLAPLAEAKKIPFFATESAKMDCEGKKFCSLFRNEEDEWGRATWKLLRKFSKKNIGIIKNQNQFMNTFVDAISRTKNSSENVEILLNLSPGTTDLRSNILRLHKEKVDALGVYLLPGSYQGFFQALKTSPKRNYFFFGVEQFLVKENNLGFKDMLNGSYAIAPAYINSYREKFEKAYGFSAGFFYTPAFYDFINLVNDIIKSNPNLRGLDLVNAMHFKGKRSGVSGEYSVKTSSKGVFSYSFPIAIYKTNQQSVNVEEIINF